MSPSSVLQVGKSWNLRTYRLYDGFVALQHEKRLRSNTRTAAILNDLQMSDDRSFTLPPTNLEWLWSEHIYVSNQGVWLKLTCNLNIWMNICNISGTTLLCNMCNLLVHTHKHVYIYILCVYFYIKLLCCIVFILLVMLHQPPSFVLPTLVLL